MWSSSISPWHTSQCVWCKNVPSILFSLLTPNRSFITNLGGQLSPPYLCKHITASSLSPLYHSYILPFQQDYPPSKHPPVTPRISPPSHPPRPLRSPPPFVQYAALSSTIWHGMFHTHIIQRAMWRATWYCCPMDVYMAGRGWRSIVERQG
jgi:hypothetical protein